MLVLERGHHERRRVGEALAPEARLPLQQLGVWGRFVEEGHLPSSGTLAAWGSAEPHENEFIWSPYGHGWHLERSRFERFLSTEAERAGVTLRRGAHVRSCQRVQGGFRLAVEVAGSLRSIHTAAIVEAAGRAGRRLAAPDARRITFDRFVALQIFSSEGSGAHSEYGRVRANSGTIRAPRASSAAREARQMRGHR